MIYCQQTRKLKLKETKILICCKSYKLTTDNAVLLSWIFASQDHVLSQYFSTYPIASEAVLKAWLEGNGTPLQYSCLANPIDGGAWWAVVHGVARSWTWLSDFTLFFHFHALEKEMATHSSVLAWRISGMRKPGGLPSMWSHRVGHDWSDLAAAAAACYLLEDSKPECVK